MVPAAPTLQETSRAPVYLDTPEMDSLVPVNESVATSAIKQLSHGTNDLITASKSGNSVMAERPRFNVQVLKQRTPFLLGSLRSPQWTS